MWALINTSLAKAPLFLTGHNLFSFLAFEKLDDVGIDKHCSPFRSWMDGTAINVDVHVRACVHVSV